ncbi:hypothetical protein CRE_26769 [Caenorhabditis remanei]|uniref:Uncharacterized protein n=1 Tax=Caenorhabditis remanei TaxID=31234 RepID=E3NDP0_CAERE|nr:hypothetical protein CRE_26769 [Caenorhabditis remanei]
MGLDDWNIEKFVDEAARRIAEGMVKAMEKACRENPRFREQVLQHERMRIAELREQVKDNVSEQIQEWVEKRAKAEQQRKKKLKQRKQQRKDRKKKTKRHRRRTWIIFREFVMIFPCQIVALELLGIKFKSYEDANLSPIILEEAFVPRNKKKKKLN